MAATIGDFIDRIQLGNDDTHQIAIGSSAYGVCSTAADQALKTVSMPGFQLNTGTTVHIKFTYANTATTAPKLSINGSDEKPIIQYDTAAAGTDADTSGWQAGAVLTLTYDGTSWVRDQGYNTNTVYTHPTTSGNKHIPSGGSDGSILGWDSDGTAKWISISNATSGLYKAKQTAFTNSTGTADSTNTSTSFIYSFSQDEDGIISDITTRALPVASTSIPGIIQIGTNSTDALAGNTVVTNVSFTNITSSNEEYPVLFKNSTGITTTDGGAYFISATNKSVTINGSTGMLSAEGGFSGNLIGDVTGDLIGDVIGSVNGNADTATSWASDQTTYVNLSSYGTDSTLNGGQDSAQVLKVTGVLAVDHGGTGTSTAPTAYGIIYAASSTAYISTTAGLEGQVLVGHGNNTPDWYEGLTLNSTTVDNTTTYSASFNGAISVAGTSTLTGKVGIGGAPNNTYQLYINGNSLYNGNLIPTLDNNDAPMQNLGSSTYKWNNLYVSAAYIGANSTYGGPTQPIYWNNGVPTPLTYTPNRLYYSTAATVSGQDSTSFAATGHYAATDGLVINDANSAGSTLTSGYTFEVNGNSLFNGNIIPTLSTDSSPIPNKTLGSTDNHWDKLYIGDTNSHGDIYTPIYWNNGEPATTTPIQTINFAFTYDSNSLTYSSVEFAPHDAITLDAQVLEIVVTSGFSYLNSEINWAVATNSLSIPTLTLSAYTSIPSSTYQIQGYVKIAHTSTLTFSSST